MKFIKRLGFYSGGFIIGLLLLFFFLSGKGASCEYSYFPNARTLKNMRNKERVFSDETIQYLKKQQLDTSAISILLANGNVLFSESNTELDSCKIYVIEGTVSEKELKISVENCDEKVTILSADSN
ncbi:MAG: hypothetical protein ACI9SJ_000650 [Flavobacteriaceae bacterium]|uniref:hypothetical protein n=1 Tax=Candidatus Marifrigoribacter sp. Uisw_064 TaxID=3230970 RepID=UPI003AE60B3C